MKNLAAALFTLAATATAYAQPGPTLPPDDCCEQTEQQPSVSPRGPSPLHRRHNRLASCRPPSQR
jgi:hypothetical protein